MQEGDKYYTFSLYSLDRNSVEQTNPFIIQEYVWHEKEYGRQAVEDLHLAFPTPNDALKAAKTLYYSRHFASMGRPYNAKRNSNYTPYYDRDTGHIGILNVDYPTPGGVYFDTEEDAKRAVKAFPADIFCHYVLGLYNVVVYVETEM